MEIKGNEMLIELNGGKKLGCLSGLNFELSREEIEAACRQAGNFTTARKGNLSGTFSVDGIVIIDNPAVPDNVRSGDLVDMMLDDSDQDVNYVIGYGASTSGDVEGLGSPGDIAGSKVLSGTAFMTSLSLSGSQDGMATYSATFRLTSKPTHAVAA
ncbi:hypothetical protein C8N40_111124 [Pontibacter mucosus]|uniref:Uncharacterized protein n=1 Tax=Pontibacter mucosus TaxID=1649266 RepID=A0A2T5YD59_9BACT|nr:hypothetical protein [Pontibacter mucosus]PTX14459.1 hypothetical protein C8N40_111124 [Pontibacter mucosus]